MYPNLLPVCYEHMEQSQTFWQNLAQKLNVELSAAGFVDRNRVDAVPDDDIDDALYQECRALYAELVQSAGSGAGL